MAVNVSHIFYAFAILFVFATVAYFAYEFLFNLADVVKAIVLVLVAVAFFFLAEFLKQKDL